MISRIIASVVVAGVCPLAATAQTAAARPDLSQAEVGSVIDRVARLIDSFYVIPDKRPTIVAKLREAQRAGRYATTEPLELSGRVSEDLQAVSGDKHLWMRWSPTEYTATAAGRPGDDATKAKYYTEVGRRRNQGIEELRILPGNIRYMRYTNFLWEADVTGQAIDDAMRFLRDGDAMIIDLRGNGGGDGNAVQYLVSHFLPADTLLVILHDMRAGTVSQNRTLGYLPAGRVIGKPLFVLTGEGTGSAAEEFTYHVQQFKLGTLVGRTTAGAANNNMVVPVAPGFMASVSFGRPVHPRSGTNWEGVGVAPDVAVPVNQALDTAEVLALSQLAASAKTDEVRAAYEWARVAATARLHPVSISASTLAAYAGRYGERIVRMDKGKLVYGRAARPDLVLVPLTGELFGFDESDGVRVRFAREQNRVVAMEVLYEAGNRQRYPRDK